MNTEQLRNKVLDLAIRGKLVSQDASDEPAIELLQKINPNIQSLTKDNPFNIPKNWCWVRFGEIVKTKIGKTPARNQSLYWMNGIHNWVSIADMEMYGFINKTKEKLSSASEIIMGEKSPIGTLIMSFKLTVGKTSILKIPAYHNEAIISIYPLIDDDFALRNYLFFVLPLISNWGESKDAIKGRTLNSKSIYNLPVPLPPLGEQKRIVTKIKEFFACIDLIEQGKESIQANIKATRQKLLSLAIQGKLVPQNPNDEPASILLDMIHKEKERHVREGKLKKDKQGSIIYQGEDGKYYERIGENIICIDKEIPFEMPQGWVWCRMGSIGDWGAGSTPSKGIPSYYGGDIPWLTTGELNNGIVYDTKTKITEKALKECSLRINKVGDILIAMYGATIGKLAIVGKEMTTNQACCACTPYYMYNYYLFYFLMASKNDFINKGEGGAQPNISREKLIHYLIPIPPLAEQKRIVEKLELLFAQLDNLEKNT